jgi:hypothetical protein
MELNMITPKNNTPMNLIPLAASLPDTYPQIPSMVRYPLIQINEY